MYRQIPNMLTLMCLIKQHQLLLSLSRSSTQPLYALIALLIFAIASATDWLDGYLARKWESVSGFGRMLDPIADKLMVIIILAALMGTAIASSLLAIPTIIIITREVMVSGLREFMAKQDFIVHVTLAAKNETTIQLIAIGFLIGTFIFEQDTSYAALSYGTGMIGIWLAALITAQTGIAYFTSAIRFINAQNKPHQMMGLMKS